MEKFIPRDKLSKKARRALDTAQRRGWGPLNPVTRKSPNPKAYDRNKARKAAIPPDGLCIWAHMDVPARRRPRTGRPSTTPTPAAAAASRTR